MNNNKPIVILTHVVNKAALQGFLPAAVALGYSVLLLTDHPLEHQQYFSQQDLPAYPEHILCCDVFNDQAVIELLLQQMPTPSAIFTNSDHLQTACSQVASYFKLAGKEWQVCYRAKNKAAMRSYLQQSKLPSVWFKSVDNIGDLADDAIVFPCVVKPQQGIASMDVQRCEDVQQLVLFCQAFWLCYPGKPLLLEQFLSGKLFTLETLGDGQNLVAVGGFDVTLSSPPHFIEREAHWTDTINSEFRTEALAQIKQFGINFGVCHSEFILTDQGPCLVEINYRSIGDGREFLLNQLAPFDWFETILRLYLGEPLPALTPIRGEAIIRYFCATENGKLTAVPALFEHHQPYRIKLEHLKSLGEQIKVSHSNKDYLSQLTAVSPVSDHDLSLSLRQKVSQLSAGLVWEISQ